jgi:hypothetical protein
VDLIVRAIITFHEVDGGCWTLEIKSGILVVVESGGFSFFIDAHTAMMVASQILKMKFTLAITKTDEYHYYGEPM